MLRASISSFNPVCSLKVINELSNHRRQLHHLRVKLWPVSNGSLQNVYKSQCRNILVWKSILRENHYRRALFNDITWSRMIGSSYKCFSLPLRRGIHLSSCARQQEDKKRDKNDRDFVSLGSYLLVILSSAVLIYVTHSEFRQSRNTVERSKISWQEFVHLMLSKGEVEHVVVYTDCEKAKVILYDGAIIDGKPAGRRYYYMDIDVPHFEAKLYEIESQLGIRPENGVSVVYKTFSNRSRWDYMDLILVALLVALLRRKMSDGLRSQMNGANFTLVEPLAGVGRGVFFSDIAGLKEAKQEVIEFVDYLKRPQHYLKLGAKIPRGTLLLGPPGCGKTLLAKAVATEGNVPFLSMNGPEFIEVLGGLGASRMRSLFQEARQRSPCIVYIDEIDAIGRKRVDAVGGEGDQTLNQLLVELDGMNSDAGVIMLASTNRADILDKALTRPGRFDRHILIDLPTAEERREIFEHHLKSLVLEETPSYYSRRLSHLTPGFSGADIANICNEAALHAARCQQKKVKRDDLDYAVDRVQYGAEKRHHSVSVNDRQHLAYYLAGRTLVGWMLKNTDAVMKVSLVQRSSSAGNFQVAQNERHLLNNEELTDRLAMHIGGRAAESLTFHKTSTLSEKDLKDVTRLAYKMVQDFGMNHQIGMVSFADEPHSQQHSYSRHTHKIIDTEARKIIMKTFETAETLLKQHNAKLSIIAEKLLEKETLTYEEICDLIGPPPHGHKKLINDFDFGKFVEEEEDSNFTSSKFD